MAAVQAARWARWEGCSIPIAILAGSIVRRLGASMIRTDMPPDEGSNSSRITRRSGLWRGTQLIERLDDCRNGVILHDH